MQKEKRDNAIMVTTRRQSGALLLGSQSNSAATSENEVNEDEIAYELLTQSAQKRRREKAREAGEETPSKRRKLPVRAKDESPAVIVHSRLAVEIPVKDVDSEGDATPQAISDVAAKLAAAESPAITPSQKKRGRPAKNAVLEDASEQLKRDVAAFEAQKASKVDKKVATPQATKSTPKSAKKGKKSPPAPAEKEEKVATPPVDSPKKETPAKPKHKKFGDDEPVAPIPLPEPLVETLEENDGSGSEDESSDDDAPEEVGGKAAQEKAQASLIAAQKAADQKQAAEDKKRKEKEEKLKAQASAAKKRKLEEEKAANEAEAAEGSASEDEDESMTLQEESSPTLEIRKEATRETKKIKFDRHNLPDLLPEDLLEDEDAMDVDSEEEERPKKARKIKFAQEEKRIKDVTLGHTTFRVQKNSKAGLAPKANKRAKMLKEALLGKRKGQIRKAPTGFFGARK